MDSPYFSSDPKEIYNEYKKALINNDFDKLKSSLNDFHYIIQYFINLQNIWFNNNNYRKLENFIFIKNKICKLAQLKTVQKSKYFIYFLDTILTLINENSLINESVLKREWKQISPSLVSILLEFPHTFSPSIINCVCRDNILQIQHIPLLVKSPHLSKILQNKPEIKFKISNTNATQVVLNELLHSSKKSRCEGIKIYKILKRNSVCDDIIDIIMKYL